MPSTPDDSPVGDLLRRAEKEVGSAAASLYEQAANQAVVNRDIITAVHALQHGIVALTPKDGEVTGALDRTARAKLELQLGRLYEDELGRLDGALLHYQKAFKLGPEDPLPLRRGRAIYRSLGDVGMVGRLFELELSNMGARKSGAVLDLAKEAARHMLQVQHDPRGAAAVLAAAIGQQPEDVVLPDDILITLAEAYSSPDWSPVESFTEDAPVEPENDPAQRAAHAAELYLALGLRKQAEGAKKEALTYLKRALGANPQSPQAGKALEDLYLDSDLAGATDKERTEELIRLYRAAERLPRRGLKLLACYRKLKSETELAKEELAAAIAACRSSLEDAESLDEWQETRAELSKLLGRAGDLQGLAQLLREDASEAALDEERAELLLSASDLYKKAQDQAGYVSCLEEAIREVPESQEAFRRLCDYHNGRRDLISVAAVYEARLQALIAKDLLTPETHIKRLEELADFYERKLQDIASSADVWRRIYELGEIGQTPKTQQERKRLGQRLSRIELSISELQLELDRTPESAAGVRADLLRKLAQQFRELHDSERAAALYEELLLFTPTDVPALKALFELRESNGDVAGQLQVLRMQVHVAADRAERLGLLRRMVALSGAQPAEHAAPLAWSCKALLSELPSDRDALRRLEEAQVHLADRKGQLETIESHLRVAPTPRDKLPLHRKAAQLYLSPPEEEAPDTEAALSHLERALRLCPPGSEQDQVILELARAYGKAGKKKEQLQAIDTLVSLGKPRDAKVQADAFRLLAQMALTEPQLADRGLRAYGEILKRDPDDLEVVAELAKLHKARGEFPEYVALLRRLSTQEQAAERRLPLCLSLADTLAKRLDDRKGAIAVLEGFLQETPLCDRQLQRRLRALYEEGGDFDQSVRAAEREFLLTEEPLERLDLAMGIAATWRYKLKDPGRAILAYERVLELWPPSYQDEDESEADLRQGRRVLAQALDALSELHSEAGRWAQVVALGEQRLELASAEPVRAALILAELAVVCEEKLKNARRAFALRRQSFELAPEVTTLAQLTAAADKTSLYADLRDVHLHRIALAHQQGTPPPLESLLAGARISEQKLHDRQAAFALLRGALQGSGANPGEIAERAATETRDEHKILLEMLALCERGGEAAATQARDLLSLLSNLVDDLCGKRGASTEDVAVRIHRLLAIAASVRENVLQDARGALEERLRAFSLGGERDRGVLFGAELFSETVSEIRRLSLVTSQTKEALQIDQRRLERAESDLIRQQVAADNAAWLDEAVGDTTKALRACIKALQLADDGSDLQAEVRGRLYSLGQRLGTLAWEEITRAERALPSPDAKTLRRRLRYIAALWEQAAGEILRAVEVTGLCYKATFFLVEAGPRGAGNLVTEVDEDEETLHERTELRKELARLSARAQTDAEGPGRVVALLDGIAAQLGELGDTAVATAVLIDAAHTDEKRGRMPHAERRYHEVLKLDPGNADALRELERLYRQNRRLSDLAALLEKRRSGLLEKLPPGPARRATLLELGEVYQQINKNFEALDVYTALAAEDETDPEPHGRIAKLHETQRAFAKAAEAYALEAQRAAKLDPQGARRGLSALLRAGEIWEKNVSSPERALQSYEGALRILATSDKESAAALSGAERMLDKLGRPQELDEILASRISLLAPLGESTDERIALLEKRLHLLRGKLAKEEGVNQRILECVKALSELRPEDEATLSAYEDLLISSGDLEGACGLARRRVAAADKREAAPEERAALLSHLSQRELALDHADAARAALELASNLLPDDLKVLAALCELREHTGDLPGYAEALRTLGEREPDVDRGAEALLLSAEVYRHQLGQGGEARVLYEQILARYAGVASLPAPGRKALSTLADLCHAQGLEEIAAAEDYARRELAQEQSDRTPDRARAAELHLRIARAAMERRDVVEAAAQYRAALGRSPGLLSATRELLALLPEGKRDSAAEAESLLQGALERAAEEPAGLQNEERARMLRQLGAARTILDNHEGAFEALSLAEDLYVGTLEEQMTLGLLAKELRHTEPAARYLLQISQALIADPHLEAGRAISALIAGAEAAIETGDAEAGRPLLTEVLRRDPENEAALGLLCEVALEGKNHEDYALAQRLYFERAERRAARGLQGESGALLQAVDDYRRSAKVALLQLAQPKLAESILGQAATLVETSKFSDPALLEQLAVARLDLARAAQDLPKARDLAFQLSTLSSPGKTRAARLRVCAELALLENDRDAARSHLLAALSEAKELGTITALVPLYGDDDAGLSQMYETALFDLVVDKGEELSLALCHAHHGQVRSRLSDRSGAEESYERAIVQMDTLDRERALDLRREALSDLGGLVQGEDPFFRRHLDALLAADPLDLTALGQLSALEDASGNKGAALRLAQVLRVVQSENPALADKVPSLPDSKTSSPIPTGLSLEETDHASLADPAARLYFEVMATIWEGVFAPKAPAIDTFGVGSADRLPPSESSLDEGAKVFATCGRVLGNRKSAVYRSQKGDAPLLRLSAAPPTALILGGGLKGLPQGELFFLIGRAVSLLRPEYILYATLSAKELANLFGLSVKAFHPRHVRHAGDQVAAWRRELPYRAVKRLSDLFRDQPDVTFSTASWRRAVRRTANRSGLLLCGDLTAAVSALRRGEVLAGEALTQEELTGDIRDLVSFWLGKPAAALAERVRPPK